MKEGVCAVIGAQFGSEGKGAVVARIASDYRNHVRVGAANAGHSFYVADCHSFYAAAVPPDDGSIHYETFTKIVTQQVPIGAFVNLSADCFIGPAAVISPDILMRELRDLDLFRMDRGLDTKPVYVDYRAHVIQGAHVSAEQHSGLAERIGSTSTIAREGIGAATASRVMRDSGCVTALDGLRGRAWDSSIILCDVPAMLHERKSVLLEGTQGTGLSITTGFFPFCTSRNTTVAGLCADAGVAPSRVDRVIAVARTYPIRVAGNSGPFHASSDEIQWGDIGIDPENERTTVTKKVRRVATFSMEQIKEAVALNGATEIALMFVDYVAPALAGANCGSCDSLALKDFSIAAWVAEMEDATRCVVSFLGTGPRTGLVLV